MSRDVLGVVVVGIGADRLVECAGVDAGDCLQARHDRRMGLVHGAALFGQGAALARRVIRLVERLEVAPPRPVDRPAMRSMAAMACSSQKARCPMRFLIDHSPPTPGSSRRSSGMSSSACINVAPAGVDAVQQFVDVRRGFA